MGSAPYISSVIFDNALDEASYLQRLPIIKHLAAHRELSFNAPVTFFVGENGTGKSTLLEAIAIAYGFNAEGGTVNFNFSTNATHSDLHKHLTLARHDYAEDGFFLRAESLYNVATNIEELDRQPAGAPFITNSYGGVSLHRQSHGESFLAIVQNRFGGNGLYILDEPEAALSPMKLLTLMTEIGMLVKKRSQFIIATHSPILMAFPDADILTFSQDGIAKTAYVDTEHFQVTKNFLDNPNRMLRYLLDDN
ncbi:MAG: AAA family ATPase [Clostridia bacterium]|nr:AAA family ATPase [Clostridia bacterium]